MENLEISVAENSANSSTDKKVNKRRSAVFKRQSIICAQQDFERSHSITEEINHESKKIRLENENEFKPFDLYKYVESLKDEDKKWRETYAKRKSRTQDLMKRGKNQETVKTMDITSLSDFERAFLTERPNYEEFSKNLVQLYAMASKVSFLNLCAENFHSKSLAKLQTDTDNAAFRIINFTD